ncbi:M35 family metallo-endopeptidase [Paraburkholderia susongensis]|uniref:Lysine-specific metallo-endopeptidase n=1 Tax=Paraburkholderia susongensis TaxID=1515439 RepID=A0A1X7LVL2_9BURK|nr:M35 family metallo-endopeptidase [Paraburkholderia susongensis]SMG57875.1 Lysine-specific metallo-endopeptidase [Paraburkholderia susongensis]
MINEFSNKNNYGFKTNENEEWFEVHSGAVTNTNPGSMVHVTIDTTPICENMTDAEFRTMIRRLLPWCVSYLDRRIDEITRFDAIARKRMEFWFGRSDEGTHQHLMNGFQKVRGVVSGLAAGNFIRSMSGLDKSLGCMPHLKNLDQEAAHVCAPNTAMRYIGIGKLFCNGLHDQNRYGDSRVSAIIHECTHFADTFASSDPMYSISTPLAMWGRNNSDLALNNADSLAGYVVYAEPRFETNDKSDNTYP